MKRKLFLIINARSGTAAIKNKLLDVLETFVLWNFEVSVHITMRQGDAMEQISKRARDFDVIVCCGGDGTINESFSALSSMSDPPPLGLIPSGTTNDFSHTLSIPDDPIEAVEIICSGKPFACDCGLFGSRIFTYSAAFGVFTNVPYETPQEQKNLLGRAAYALEAIKNIQAFSPFNIRAECKQGVFEGEYILGMITNTKSIAGFRNVFTDIAKLDDGLMEVTLVKNPKTFSDFQTVLNVLTGIERLSPVQSDFLTVFSTGELDIQSDDPIPWTLDGEEGGILGNVGLKVLPKAVSVMVKQDFSL